MVRKKIDNRLRILIENGVASGHRSLFVVVGDKGRDQVPILHHMLSKATIKARPSVLWCFKKELGFSSHRKKKMKHLQKKIKHGQFDANEDDPFELFVAATSIRYCYYKETHKILGNTYGMCVLQDFEALTPNLLARTMETVEGGGIIVLMLKTVDSLKQLFTLSMDVHMRYRTEAHQDVVGRFNERFILSLSSNKRCIVIDDQLNILPLSSHVKNISEIAPQTAEEAISDNDKKLSEIMTKLEGSQPTESLVKLCKTLDQAQALLQFIDAITDKKLDCTVSLTAARGRGKSAALGLAIAAAVGFGYSNIFVTSPSPENLHTLFDFIFKGFDAMEYEEHTDYDIVQSTNPEFNNAVVRVNIQEGRHNHRQTIQYLHPGDAHKLGQAELVVIDEAAAIPLPLVKALLGPYLVFMSSTINGYEGTGRSLSLKLLDQLRRQASSSDGKKVAAAITCRGLREVALEESIRYKAGDSVEEWLNRMLCLDANTVSSLNSGCPPPDECDLYYINRDTLFSYHKASEAFLQRIMSLFVASHYKNTPNDLQMMSDAPAHHLFCLLGPTKGNSLPEVLCAIQVCLEGEISKQSIMSGLSRGKRASGDLIPWTMAQQYQDDNFPSLSGARIVRIATHPDYQKMGYGSMAMKLLERYYQMEMVNLDDNASVGAKDDKIATVDDDSMNLLEERLRPRENLPPLLLRLNERKPEKLDYLGVSFGLTQDLLRFWKRLGFTPTYLRQTANDLTGEHSTILLKLLQDDQKLSTSRWLNEFWQDFRRRIVSLMGFEFRKFSGTLALTLLSDHKKRLDSDGSLTAEELSHIVTPYDLKRLELYCSNMADFHLIMDLLPNLARIFFLHQLGGGERKMDLSPMQKLILVGVGLQYKSVDNLGKELDLPVSQLLGLFNRMMRKFVAVLKGVREEAITTSLQLSMKQNNGAAEHRRAEPIDATLEEELRDAADETQRKQQEAMEKLRLQDLSHYRIKGNDEEWSKALGGKGTKTLVSVKIGEKRINEDAATDDGKKKKKKKQDKRKGMK